MTAGGTPRFRRFWLSLIVGYIASVAVWIAIRPAYHRHVGAWAAPLVPLLTVDRTHVERTYFDSTLIRFVLIIQSKKDGEWYRVRMGVDPAPYGYGHVTLAALALAIPGWTWWRRLLRWLTGAILLQAFFVFMILLQLFSGFVEGSNQFPYWSGDRLTPFIPIWHFIGNRGVISIIAEQFVPILLWLAIFVFPRRYTRAVKNRRAATQGRPYEHVVRQP
ncbi:MAG: hypothetical protein AB1792_05305 [Candidatus Zixiibacteriota bacterium]